MIELPPGGRRRCYLAVCPDTLLSNRLYCNDLVRENTTTRVSYPLSLLTHLVIAGCPRVESALMLLIHYFSFVKQISSPYGHQLHYDESTVDSKFGFTAKESGQYMACFWLPRHSRAHSVMVELQWKIGMAAKDWEGIAKQEKLAVR